MNEPLRRILIVSGCVALLAGLVFLCSDCAGGRTRCFECEVVGHHYQPSWVETRVSTDSDGHIQTDAFYHPEQFTLVCRELGEETKRIFDVPTSRGRYYATRDGEPTTVGARVGRWTGVAWLPRICSQ